VGWLCEQAWRRLPLAGQPPLTRYLVSFLGKQVTLDDSKARRELGYAPRVTFAEGIEALQATAD
jgi:nucleoside-diphosphate-sugar epimerase